MRVLIVTKIFPNPVEPLSSPFNRRQFSALSRLCDVQVLATIPWFPGASAFQRWSMAGRLGQVPEHERIDGLHVRHPRVAFLPKLGRGVAGPLYAASLASVALEYRGRVDVVLGSWAYPDGFGAVVLADMLDVPAVIKLHGSDMNVVARWPGPRRRLSWALPRAERVVAVNRPLAQAAVALGARPERIDIVPNGVDRDTFHPRDQREARRELGVAEPGPLLLFVGHLLRSKGVLDLLAALRALSARRPDARLVVVGEGADEPACRQAAAELGERVSFVGCESPARVATWLAACDLLALPSWNEGTPNVVLEALACGRPVVGSRVGGIPDLLRGRPHALVPARDVPALGAALERTLAEPYDAAAISAALRYPDWNGSARMLHDSLLSALQRLGSEAA
jgi:glycosyltransferase involved in cell wall biosynthesis